MAKLIAEETGAELFEIVPEEPYTAEDLAYNNDNCRANREMNDDTARPAISSDLSGVSGCEAVYLGYPIWWGTAPRIIQTFLDSGALDGATVYLFCTSGGSGMGNTNKELAPSCAGASLREGKVFSARCGESELKEWAKKFN